MFENISSSNTDMGDIWCSTPTFARLVEGHCNEEGTKRPFVKFDSVDGGSTHTKDRKG